MKLDLSNDKNTGIYFTEISKDKKPLRHKYYYQNVEHCEKLELHINGDLDLIRKLLDDYRPNEPQEIKEYRLKNVAPITKSAFKKVNNVLARINNAKNYSIVYDDDISKLIKNDSFDESLQNYSEKEYPYFGNIIQWIFDVAFKQMLSDPNAVSLIIPLEDKSLNGFVKPFCTIFKSRQVVDFDNENYFTLWLDEKSTVKNGNQDELTGNIYWVITKTDIVQFKQVGNKTENKYEKSIYLKHNLNEMPIVILGGEYISGSYPFCYESYISGVLPYWDKALRQDNDKEAVIVQHVYMERVEIQVECDAEGCTGGKIHNEKDITNCKRCSGSGWISGRSPYGITSVKQDSLNKDSTIFPGVQYIQKPIEILDALSKEIDNNIMKGYSAINMDGVLNVGAVQSGIAKTIDRSDLDSYFMQISNNIFDNILYYSLRIINKYRYMHILTNPKELEAQLPTINKPTSFDVLSSTQLTSQLASYNSAGLPKRLIDILTLDVINKIFSNDENSRNFYSAVIELNPLPNYTVDEKLAMSASDSVDALSVIVSNNIDAFITKASNDNEDFYNLDYNEKMKILNGYAKSLTLIETDQLPLE